MGAAYQEQAKVFKALCDPKRLAILEQLRSGEKCACVLQELSLIHIFERCGFSLSYLRLS